MNYAHMTLRYNETSCKWYNPNRRIGSKTFMYHVSCEPLRIFWNDDTTCLTWVSRVLPTTGWIPGFSACSGQHAWHSCRAGCIVISENPQGLAIHMVRDEQSCWQTDLLADEFVQTFCVPTRSLQLLVIPLRRVLTKDYFKSADFQQKFVIADGEGLQS